MSANVTLHAIRLPQTGIEPAAAARDREAASIDKTMRRDLKTLVQFVRIYCRHRHAERPKAAFVTKVADLASPARGPIMLCEECQKLLTHALVKRTHCPMQPKPACKHCPNHCYHPTYRARIREVMKFSGRKLVMSGRLDLLFHLLF